MIQHSFPTRRSSDPTGGILDDLATDGTRDRASETDQAEDFEDRGVETSAWTCRLDGRRGYADGGCGTPPYGEIQKNHGDAREQEHRVKEREAGGHRDPLPAHAINASARTRAASFSDSWEAPPA